MNTTALRWPVLSLVVVAAAGLLSACADTRPTGLDRQPAIPTQHSVNTYRAPELGTCTKLAPPAGSKLVFHVFAKGVQIYRWNGTAWAPVGPSATLSADANGRSVVGTHYEGPTWESVSGSRVVGKVFDRCTPNANAIAWLLLTASSAEGPGVFDRVTHIQRVNTAGGNPPATPGVVGEEVRIPYTTEYYFYRAP